MFLRVSLNAKGDGKQQGHMNGTTTFWTWVEAKRNERKYTPTPWSTRGHICHCLKPFGIGNSVVVDALPMRVSRISVLTIEFIDDAQVSLCLMDAFEKYLNPFLE